MQASSFAIDDYRWLIGDQAKEFIQLAADTTAPQQRIAEQLRQALSPERVRLVVELADLRWRAREKFWHANRMFFTSKGLEQATDDSIATHKANRFRDVGLTADFCCGIGGDLISLCASNPASRGVDRDPILALFAQANCLAVLGIRTHVDTKNVAEPHLDEVDAWHIDPDRRAKLPRTIGLADSQPSFEQIRAWLRHHANAAIKVAPAYRDPAGVWPEACEREWISSRRECRQQVLWFGRLAQSPGQRRATMVRSSASAVDSRPQIVVASFAAEFRDGNASEFDGRNCVAPRRYVLDVDPAIRAAELMPQFAAARQLQGLGNSCSYLTGDTVTNDAFLTPFEVLDAVALDERKIKRLLRERRIGQLELKQKGTKRNLDQLAATWAVPGENRATILLYRQGLKERALIARRLPP